MWREPIGVLAGSFLWMAGFLLLAIGVAQLWPDYALHGRDWFEQGVFTFTAGMAWCNVAFWAVADVWAGWITAKIARTRRAVLVLALLIVGYLALMHFVLSWDVFPWWYNVGVVLPSLPAILFGGWMGLPLAVAHSVAVEAP